MQELLSCAVVTSSSVVKKAGVGGAEVGGAGVAEAVAKRALRHVGRNVYHILFVHFAVL